jgi:hypothetical protein
VAKVIFLNGFQAERLSGVFLPIFLRFNSFMAFLSNNIAIGKWKIPVPVLLWFLLAMLAAVAEISRGISSINNYQIFTGVFHHTIQQKNLYLPYPGEYSDLNHYGPLFSLVIAPFAFLPDNAGCFAWCVVNAWVLFYAIRQLNLTNHQQNGILLIGLVEMLTSIHNVQFNPMLTGWIILSYVFVEKEKDFWATLFIVAGFMTKIYGIAGIAFFWFSKHKLKFIASFLFWFVVLFCLPMIISSPAFIIQSYKDWYQSLVEKNERNINLQAPSFMQDISVMGMISRIGRINQLNNLLVLVPAAILHALPLVRYGQYRHAAFRMSYLCLTLIGVVIFSSSAESPTFVIAVTGIGIWYVIQIGLQRSFKNALLLFVILLTSLSATDLFPSYVREHIIAPYSLKALPCFVVWCVLVYQLLNSAKSYRDIAE